MPVLNAFRHHRNSHKDHLIGQLKLRVLNAFRHHRNSHPGSRIKPGILAQCSTPFGIIGIHTLLIVIVRDAFCECSTPFGIIGIHTLDLYRYAPLLCGAQRLSASSEFTLLVRCLSSRAR